MKHSLLFTVASDSMAEFHTLIVCGAGQPRHLPFIEDLQGMAPTVDLLCRQAAQFCRLSERPKQTAQR